MCRVLPVVFALLVAAALGQAAWQQGHLPAQVATGFNSAGQPDAWTSRGTRTAWQTGMILGIAGLMEGIARLNARLPDNYVNIPRREYWLAPEHRAATHQWLRGAIRAMGCILLLFFLGLYHLAYLAGVRGAPMPTLPTGLLVLAGGLGLVAVAVGVFLRFNRLPR